MLGAIIGDIVGSSRERHNIKTEDFELITERSRFTDDTVMTLAVAEWLMSDPEHSKGMLIECMKYLGKRYPGAGYGHNFFRWIVSKDPQPYNSYGNGSAMRVSPIGLYASSLDEAMDLAKTSAEVSHNHPEGIKGAQAIAACVFLQKQGTPKSEIKEFVQKHFGYDLDIKLEDIRDEYRFSSSCQGSVPIAIMAFLQRDNAEDILRLAISMGGDSDTIGCMAASIATARKFDDVRPESTFSDEINETCEGLLTFELLDICNRFENFISKPLDESFYVAGNVFAGEYPGDTHQRIAEGKINSIVRFGVRNFIDLTEANELEPYQDILPEGTTYYRFPIKDLNIPTSTESVHQLIDRIDELAKGKGYTYLHCWGGVGRTGTIVACYLARHTKNPSTEEILDLLRTRFQDMPKSEFRTIPETKEQIEFIDRFIKSCKSL